MRRRLWLTVLALMVPVVLLAVLGGYFAQVRARYDTAVAAYVAAGEPMSEAALGWPELADEDNAAVELVRLAQAPTLPSVEAMNAALDRPALRWDAFNTHSGLVSQLGVLRHLAWQLTDDARQAAVSHDPERFIARVEQVHRLGERVSTHTPLVGFLVGLAMQDLAAQLVLEHDLMLGAQAVGRLQALFTEDRDKQRQRIVEMSRAERLYAHLDLTRPLAPGSGLSKWVDRQLMLRDGPLLLTLADVLRDSLLAERPADADTLVADFQQHRFRHAGHATVAAIPKTFLASYRRLQTHQRLALALLAVRQYEQRHGRLPDGLDELIADAGPGGLSLSALTDPFDPDARPLRYNPRTGLLYSVGLDRADGGGRIVPEAVADGTSDPWAAPDRGVRLFPEADAAAGR